MSVGRERLSDEVADLLPGVDADERERAIDLVVGRCIQVARDQVGRDGHYDGPTMVVTELERLL